MSVHHLTIDELSAYIDEELHDRERHGVESHLEDCDDCRQRLDGLRSVALQVRNVERLAPPPLLEHSIRRQLSLVDRDVPAWRRSRLVGKLQSNLLLLFALVIALALMVGLFSDALSRLDAGGGSTIVAPRGGVGFVEDPSDGELIESADVRVAVVAGRHFEHRGDVWRERATGPVQRWLSAAEARQLLATDAALATLWRSGAAAVVLFAPTAADSGDPSQWIPQVVGISQATASEVLSASARPENE